MGWHGICKGVLHVAGVTAVGRSMRARPSTWERVGVTFRGTLTRTLSHRGHAGTP
jgi:hypothetical protein